MEDFIDDDLDATHEEYKAAAMCMGLKEDEAENMLEDMGL